MTSTRRRFTLLFAAAAAVAALAGTVTGPAAPATAAWAPQVERLSGSDRYQTAIAISKKFPDTASRVFIATGAAFPDALSLSATAAAAKSPLLLVQPNAIPAGVVNEIKRIGPSSIVIAGGTGAVSKNVENQLAKLGKVVRLSGADRYATSLAIAKYGPWDNTFVATGRDFPDALAAAPVAGTDYSPVVLVDGKRSSLTTAAKAAIGEHDPQAGIVMGGTSVVSSGIYNQLDSLHPQGMFRFAGHDRYETAVKLNDFMWGDTYKVAYLAAGNGFADALAGGALAADNGALFLVQSGCVPGSVLDSLNAAKPAKIVLLGGKGALSDNVAKLKRCA